MRRLLTEAPAWLISIVMHALLAVALGSLTYYFVPPDEPRTVIETRIAEPRRQEQLTAELDAGDVSTGTLRTKKGAYTVTPRGWTDKALGATDDGGAVWANTSELSIYCGERAAQHVWAFDTATTQSAARTITVKLTGVVGAK